MTENVREMTFDEGYEILLKEKDELFATEKEDCEPPFANCVVRRALRCIRKLLEEIQQYRAIGTVEEFKALKKIHSDCSIKHLAGECSYNETGCSGCKGREIIKSAVERMKPKKVVTTNGFCIGKTKGGEEIYRVVESCPTCGLTGLTNLSKAGWKNYYCPRCGQCID